MNVLLVGMKKADNQFTRGLEQYAGLSYVHCDSTHRGELPPCDVAILATCQMGQSQLNYAKQHFKDKGTPYIIAGQSFSRIKEQFDQILSNKGFLVNQPKPVVQLPSQSPVHDDKIRRSTTAMGHAFKTATAPSIETVHKKRFAPTPLPKFRADPSDNFKSFKELLFKKEPAIGGMLGTFQFRGFEDNGQTLVIVTKDENKHICDNITRDELIQSKILSLVQLFFGRHVKHVLPILIEPQVISGMELGEKVDSLNEQGVSMPDIIKHLESNNFVKPSRKPWTDKDLYEARRKYRITQKEIEAAKEAREFQEKLAKKIEEPKPVPTLTPPPPVVVQPVTLPPIPESLKPKPPPAPKVPSTPEELRVRDELIGKVLAMKDMPPLKKLELIEEINAGVRTVEHQVIAERKEGKFQLTAQSIFHPEDKPLLVMDKALARDIVSAIEEIKAYLGE